MKTWHTEPARSLIERWESATGSGCGDDEGGEYLLACLQLAYRCRGYGLKRQEETLMGWAEDHVKAAEEGSQ